MVKRKELKVGDTLTVWYTDITGLILRAEIGDQHYWCNGCFWQKYRSCPYKGNCMPIDREDGQNIIFKYVKRFDITRGHKPKKK